MNTKTDIPYIIQRIMLSTFDVCGGNPGIEYSKATNITFKTTIIKKPKLRLVRHLIKCFIKYIPKAIKTANTKSKK
jgi:hypothetical protein